MRLLLASHTWYVVLLAIVGGGVLLWLISSFAGSGTPVVTAVTEAGAVQETVSVSGVAKAVNVADLSFPVTGTVTDVLVTSGSAVEAGDVLATIGSEALVAERRLALAELTSARAAQSEAEAGASPEAAAVALTKRDSAEAAAARAKAEAAISVENARRALYSNALAARPLDPDENGAAPVVSGTYTCAAEGRYEIVVYSAGSPSGYAYTYKGLEAGISEAYTEHAGPIGSCGLSLQFTAGEQYNRSTWYIDIPNKEAATYTDRLNAYDLAVQEAASSIEAATDALALATEETVLATGSARSEVVAQRAAAVAAADARVEAIDAQLRDRAIVAPFAGIITNVRIETGEIANATPVMTIVARDAFELTARIPEIDITRISEGQAVSASFDARRDEPVAGIITYISPIATEIDGVAYFETTIELANYPQWLRSGLNADVEIVIAEVDDSIRLPARFLVESEGGTYVLTQHGREVEQIPVEVLLRGNDGFVAVRGISGGETIVAP